MTQRVNDMIYSPDEQITPVLILCGASALSCGKQVLCHAVHSNYGDQWSDRVGGCFVFKKEVLARYWRYL